MTKVSAKTKGQFLDQHGQSSERDWALAEESAIQLFFNGQSFGVMMITPENVDDFVRGFCLSEGLFNPKMIEDIRIESARNGLLVNAIVPQLETTDMFRRQRNQVGRSACGLCGAQTLAEALPKMSQVRPYEMNATALATALDDLPSHQIQNAQNHSSHAAGLASASGEVMFVREDVGRHNALDKLIGALWLNKIATQEGALLLSSRVSIEMVQKAIRAGFSNLVSISAPTQLAVDTAQASGLALYCRADAGLMRF